MIFGRARRLAAAGVLGMNARNERYIGRWNPRELYPNVDDKVRAKALVAAAGVVVPRNIAVISAYGELRSLARLLGSEASFAMKPVRGSGGNGVIVVASREGPRFVRHDGSTLLIDDLAYHASGILAGLHSLGGRPDGVLVEERLVAHPVFAGIVAGGVPDIRVIVFRGVPVMAMTRLPTRRSGGRANLHQGAVAAGIDLATGTTSRGLYEGHPTSTHPDTGVTVVGVTLPSWGDVLEISACVADAIGLGYVGVDIVLDGARGPVFLEANVRPGLAIQLANGVGLGAALAAVEALDLRGRTVPERVELGRRLSSLRP